MKRIILIITLALSALCLPANAAMVRVVSIDNGRTITIDDHGTRTTVRLAGVTITDELHAREMLRWTIGDAWVMLERNGDDVLVYRSPDALFINRELVVRGFARATLAGIEPEHRLDVTYLGEVNPGSNAAPQSRSGTGTRRRSATAPTPAPAARSPRSPSSVRSGPAASRAPKPEARSRGPRPPGSSR